MDPPDPPYPFNMSLKVDNSNQNVHKLSFKEIMDEEFAKKLQKEFENEYQQFVTPSQEEIDFMLALKLSQEEQHKAPLEETVIESNETAEQLSEDYLLALQLQNQWNEENRHTNQNGARGAADANYSNISLNFQSLNSENHVIYEEEEDEEEEDEEEIDEFNSSSGGKEKEENKLIILNNNKNSLENEKINQNQNQTNLQQSQDPQQNEFELVTKHDRILCGVKNSKTLETQISVNSGNLYPFSLPNPVYNDLNQHAAVIDSRKVRKHGKEDRETRENVLDQKTRLLLYKMINKQLFKQVGGIISSGKEANVYQAIIDLATLDFLALKIYKTTLNEFKNREEYIKDDFRYKNKFSKQNSRKLIHFWAEKEAENLNKLSRAGIRCPKVIIQKKNILLMSFIGNKEMAAPQLTQVQFPEEKMSGLYWELVKIIRKLFHICQLVHSDLSEYNILYHKHHLWIIDVAQSVDIHHPNALFFLQRDCLNITKFFRKRGLYSILTVRELYNFVIDTHLNDNEDTILSNIMENCMNRFELSYSEKQDEEIFIKSFIPVDLLECITPDNSTSAIYSPASIIDAPITDPLPSCDSPAAGEEEISIKKEVIIEEEVKQEEEEEVEETREWVEKVTLTKDEQRKLRKEAKKAFKLKKREQKNGKNSVQHDFLKGEN